MASKNLSLSFSLLLLSLLSSASASPSLGTWSVLHRSIGISAMHMQLLRTGHVIIFDRTDFGLSNLSLPRGTPCRLAQDDVLPLDCSAHSLLYSLSRNPSVRPLSITTDVFCSSGAVDPGGTLIQTGGYLAGDRKIRVFRPCKDDDVAGCDWSELFRQRLAVRRWYATNQILPDGRVVIVGGRKQFSYEFFPKTATSAPSGFSLFENNATSAASGFYNPTRRRSWNMLENATSASDNRVGKSATSAASGYGFSKTATSALFNYNLPKTATTSSVYSVPKTATSADRVYSLPFLKSTTDPFEENNLYPFLHLLPNGDLFIFANRRAIQFNYKKNKIVREFPAIPGEKRNYPSSGSSVLLPLREPRPDPEVMVCGGAPDGAYYMANNMSVYVSASNTCGRLKITGLDPSWEMENMPMNRVMSDMLLLPTGDVLIINGASNGTAGWEDATGPVLNPVLYNPTRRRFTVLNPTAIPRMYHSAAILLPDGRILVGGSNPHKNYNFTTNNYPTDLSLEAFYPPYMSPDYSHLRPSILSVEIENEIVSYGHNFSLTFVVGPFRVFDRGLTASLIAPPFTTHAFGMNQRLVFLQVIAIQRLPLFGYNKVMLHAPSSPNIAPPGYYMLFLVHVGVPGECVWVKVGN